MSHGIHGPLPHPSPVLPLAALAPMWHCFSMAEDLVGRLKTALADRYIIERELGAGGMATVYLARDLKHDRLVAVKVLRPELAATIGAERFLREIKTTAQLNHPHILPLHDSGEADGFLYYVMPFVEGESLRDRLNREEALPHADVLRIACEVADALSHAHGHNVVHRDIKPENILLSGGHAVVADFGIAKAISDAGGDQMTAPGWAVGTPAYMSPEQALGADVDVRTDIWALGAVLFEMLTNSPPFAGDNPRAVMSAAMTAPPMFDRLPDDGHASLETVLRRALEKDRKERFASADELLSALRAAQGDGADHEDVQRARKRLRGVAVGAGVLLLVIGMFSVRLIQQQRRVRWVRVNAIPEITGFIAEQRYVEAFRLLREADRYLTDDPQLGQLMRSATRTVAIETTPPGAGVYVRDYLQEGDWEYIGDAPMSSIDVPTGYLRWQARQSGHHTAEGAFETLMTDTVRFVLVADTSPLSEMVPIPAGSYQRYSGVPIQLDGYWLDRFEVTNQAYQNFVDAGAYRDSTLWTDLMFEEDGRRPSVSDAVDRFRDATGRQGPAVWELGRYPSGTARQPVRGVSWFEAAAYCAFVGKRLPTYHHWFRAANPGIYSDILLLSNFGSEGPAVAGTHEGVTAFGNYDMAGNVKEWTWTAVGSQRYILGGAWDEPAYQFAEDDARLPFDRSPSHGFRCARSDRPPEPALLEPVDARFRLMASASPVPDEVFEVFRRLYASDDARLDAQIDSVDDARDDWRQELVSFNAAYDDERVLARLYIPKRVAAPYQAVIFFPGTPALQLRSSDGLPLQSYFDFVARSGRVLVHPVYKGTYERFTGVREPQTGASSERHNAWRDQVIDWVRDMRRTIDYLETRDDIESGKIAYLGLSLGGRYGPIFSALEDRFAAAVFIAGGFAYAYDLPDEILPVHFAPRSHVPTVMINGSQDFIRPIETSVQPMFDLLGTPPADKRLALFPLGHLPPINETARETLDWLDRYLGVVGAVRR